MFKEEILAVVNKTKQKYGCFVIVHQSPDGRYWNETKKFSKLSGAKASITNKYRCEITYKKINGNWEWDQQYNYMDYNFFIVDLINNDIWHGKQNPETKNFEYQELCYKYKCDHCGDKGLNEKNDKFYCDECYDFLGLE